MQCCCKSTGGGKYEGGNISDVENVRIQGAINVVFESANPVVSITVIGCEASMSRDQG